MLDLRRRQLITLLITLLGGAAAWPLAARAQQPAMPVIGFLGTETLPTHLVAAFRQGLKDVGYVEGQNVAFEYRPAGGDYERFHALVEELVRRQVAVIVATNTAAAVAAKETTSTIPIVFYISGDPVTHGLATSFNRPGGNATGVSFLSIATEAKRLELLRELAPRATETAMLVNPRNADADADIRNVQEAARMLGHKVTVVEAGSTHELEGAFATLAQRGAHALLIGTDGLFTNQRDRLAELAARYAILAIYDRRDFADAGGLISYGHHRVDAYRQLGIYAGQILKGIKPADLPVVQPTKFELVINLKTAKAFGLIVPDKLLALADEVIE